MRSSKPLLAVALIATAISASADPLLINFEGATGAKPFQQGVLPVNNFPVSIDSYYNGGFSTGIHSSNSGQQFAGPTPSSGVTFLDAIGTSSQERGGLANFTQPPSLQIGVFGTSMTAMTFANTEANPAYHPTTNPNAPQFLVNTATLSRPAGFDGGFSFYFSSKSNLHVKAFAGEVALDLTVDTIAPMNKDLTRSTDAMFDAQAFDNCTAGTGSISNYCNWSYVNVTFAAGVKATSIQFFNTSGTGGIEGDAGGFGTLIDGVRLNNTFPLAVPEPSTYALMALGLLGIGFMRRRQMRQP